MQVKIDPDAPDVYAAMLAAEGGHPITSMDTILRQSLVDDTGIRLTPEQADTYLGHMSYNQMNEIGEKFEAAMKALKAVALPPTGAAPSSPTPAAAQ